MIVVYVLQSIKNGIHYVGMTEDIERRLIEHNSGKSKFTSAFIPWKLIYSELAPNREEGRKKEKYFKSAAGKKYVQKKILTGSLPD